jgi:hypothetical protein
MLIHSLAGWGSNHIPSEPQSEIYIYIYRTFFYVILHVHSLSEWGSNLIPSESPPEIYNSTLTILQIIHWPSGDRTSYPLNCTQISTIACNIFGCKFIHIVYTYSFIHCLNGDRTTYHLNRRQRSSSTWNPFLCDSARFFIRALPQWESNPIPSEP